MDKLDYCATLNNLESISNLKNFRFVKGDIQSLDLVLHVLDKEEVDTIMHFAAQVRPLQHKKKSPVTSTASMHSSQSSTSNTAEHCSQKHLNHDQLWPRPTCCLQTHVDNSFGNSLAFTMNNTYGTHVLLEAARVHGGIRRFINVSTDEVYGESSLGKEFGCDETSTLEPTNPYSAAKAGATPRLSFWGIFLHADAAAGLNEVS